MTLKPTDVAMYLLSYVKASMQTLYKYR